MNIKKEKPKVNTGSFILKYGLNNKIGANFFLAGICDILVINIAFKVYLPGFAVFANANDTVIEILSSLFICTFMANIFSPHIYSKMKNLHKTVISFQIMSLVFLNMVVLIPLLFKGSFAEYLILISAFAAMILYGIFLSGYNIWVMTSIAVDKRLAFVSLRESTARIICIITVLILGIVIDKFNKGYIGFLIIYSLSFVVGFVENISLRRIMNSTKDINLSSELKNKKLSLKSSIKIAWADIKYRKVCIANAAVFFIAWICYPLRYLYMLKYIGLSYTAYSAIINIWLVLQAVFTLIWSKISNRIGFDKILHLLMLFYCAEYAGWIFVTKGTVFMLVPVYFFSGVANSALPLIMLNGRYEYMPDENKIAYESFYNILIGTAWLAGLFTGIFFRHAIPVPKAEFFGGTNIQLMFLISFTFGILYFFLSKKYISKS